MLFRRRDRPAVGERIRIFFVPRRNYARSFKYFGKRVLRLTGSPHSVAAGVAAGVAASCTPFIGFHFVLAFVLAFLVRGNMIAAALGTAVGNPLTFPFIWVLTFNIGNAVQGLWRDGPPARLPPHFIRDVGERGWDAIQPLLLPMVIGALPLAIATATVFYAFTRGTVGMYQENRRRKLAERRAGLREDSIETD